MEKVFSTNLIFDPAVPRMSSRRRARLPDETGIAPFTESKAYDNTLYINHSNNDYPENLEEEAIFDPELLDVLEKAFSQYTKDEWNLNSHRKLTRRQSIDYWNNATQGRGSNKQTGTSNGMKDKNLSALLDSIESNNRRIYTEPRSAFYGENTRH